MKKLTVVLITALTASMAVQAAESTPDMKVNPDAQYTYAETAECLSSVVMLNKMGHPAAQSIAMMLGQLPTCEVEKVIIAIGDKRANELIELRKISHGKPAQ